MTKLAEVHAFLDGSAPLEGVWWGESHPTRKGAFWWRSVLREANAVLTDENESLRIERDALIALSEQRKLNPTKFDVMVLTTAYEQGFGKGLQDRGVPNVYVQDSPAFHAWNLGYDEGQMRLKEQKSEQPKDVAQLLGDLDAKMHKSFASQKARTNPVVSQDVVETVDKDCDTCNNRQRRMHQEPCFSCHGYTNWEPKP